MSCRVFYCNVSPLSYTGEDAASFVKAFREVGGLMPSRLYLIADQQPESLRLETSATSVRGAISQVCSLAQPADTFIFFFSGHGFRDNENQMYLATQEFHCVYSSIALSVGSGITRSTGNAFQWLLAHLL